MIHSDVIIIGAGAAGLMCAITAAKRGRRVIVLDHAEKPGKKILISGGGRCNFTNLSISADNYISQNPHFCKSALSRYSNYDFISLLEKHDLSYQEKVHGQLFCKEKSAALLNILLQECQNNQVTILLNQKDLKVKQQDKGFMIYHKTQQYTCESLVIASGGQSIKKMGASDFGYQLAKQFKIPVVETRPGLVPFILPASDLQRINGLSGISCYAQVCCGQQCFKENILFTHKGLSGPAILQISNYWQPYKEVEINLMPESDLEKEIEKWKKLQPEKSIKSLLASLLSKRLVEKWLEETITNIPVRQINDQHIKTLIELFNQWKIMPADTQGYRIAEVTLGGVDTKAVSSKTFAVNKIPNLYFIGEVLDVTGWLGGYNFQWAWSSGYCAGNYV